MNKFYLLACVLCMAILASSRGALAAWTDIGCCVSSATDTRAVATYAGTSQGVDLIDVYALDGGNHMWVNSLRPVSSAPTWSGWNYLGGTFPPYPPTAVAWANPDGSIHREVFGIGGDSTVWHNYTDGATWWGWTSLGGPPQGFGLFPSAVSWGLGRIDLFVPALGSNVALAHTWTTPGCVWCGWDTPTSLNLSYYEGSLGKIMVQTPVAISTAANTLDVFIESDIIEANNQKIYDVNWNASQGWTSRDTKLTGAYGAPGLSATQTYSGLAAFAWEPGGVGIRGSWYVPGGYYGWTVSTLGSQAAFIDLFPAVQSGSNSSEYPYPDLFFLEPGGTLGKQAYEDGSWSTVQQVPNLPAVFSSVPTLVRGSSNVYLFAVDNQNHMWVNDSM